jgi:predicted RNA-binding protein YlqC (UPF0109 family)
MRPLNLEEEIRDLAEMIIEWNTDSSSPQDYEYEDNGRTIKITLHPIEREAGALIGRNGTNIRSMGMLMNAMAMRRKRRVKIEVEPK